MSMATMLEFLIEGMKEQPYSLKCECGADLTYSAEVDECDGDLSIVVEPHKCEEE